MAEPNEALVPCESVGLGTGTATVLNVTTGEAVRITNVPGVTLVNRVAHVRLPVVMRKGKRALVRLGDTEVWGRGAREG